MTFLEDIAGPLTVLFVGCLTSRQHASVSQGRICSDNFTCCHTEVELVDPTLHLIQSQRDSTPESSALEAALTVKANAANGSTSANGCGELRIVCKHWTVQIRY